jgi:hypothetical protein
VTARPGLRAAMLVGFSVLLVACGSSRSVSSYEPGVYKGADDPLLDLQATPEHQQRLRERFTMGQAQR